MRRSSKVLFVFMLMFSFPLIGGVDYEACFNIGSEARSADLLSISPENHAEILNHNVTFGWKTIEGATEYVIQVCTDSDFKHTIIMDRVEGATFTPEAPLKDGTYYWKVMVRTGNDESFWLWSAAAEFTVSSLRDVEMLATNVVDLDVQPLMQHKDTGMLCLDGCDEFGPHAWNKDHVVRGCDHCDNYCVRGSIAMINRYYGGSISQDRISYYIFGGGPPEDDLGHGQGVTIGDASDALSWSLGGATIDHVIGKPSFAQTKAWIDAGSPIFRVDVEGHSGHATVIDGYEENDDEFVHIVDPWTATEYIERYQAVAIHEVLVPPTVAVGRHDEPTVHLDSDSDGVVDFDEIVRFHTDWLSSDSDGDGYQDMLEIESYTFYGGDPDQNDNGARTEMDPVEAPQFTKLPLDRPGELLSATLDGAAPETVDPAWCYDSASAEPIFNIYETLIFFDCEENDGFLPQLATAWTVEDITGTSSPLGLPWYYKYTFEIRTGVQFHNGHTLTPEDVEYSFERAMIQDRTNGPTWMLYEPLLDTWGPSNLADLTSPSGIIDVGMMIDHSVESNISHVWFNLAFPGDYRFFLQILSQPWSSVISKQWVTDFVIGTLGRPDWNGEWGDYLEWIAYFNPSVSPLDDPTPIACGTGPFQLDTVDYTLQLWAASRFVNYWRGWPANWPIPPGRDDAGYVDTVRVEWAYGWPLRGTLFRDGHIDFCAIPRQFKWQVLGKSGIRSYYPLPMLSLEAFFFTFNIDPATPYGRINNPGNITGDAIPCDFFGNETWGIHVRKAFAHSFDYDWFIQSAYAGEAVQPATAVLPELPYYDSNTPKYSYDLAKAENEFRIVPGLWETGFHINIAYTQGNLAAEIAARQLAATVENLNYKFKVTVVSIAWVDLLEHMKSHQLPLFFGCWSAVYPDSHAFAFSFYHSAGALASSQCYSSYWMDALVEDAVRTPDGPDKAAIISEIQALATEECPSVPIVQPLGRHYERDWCVGWYYNPLYCTSFSPSLESTAPGSHGIYFYNLWKWHYVKHALYNDSYDHYTISNLLPFDVNYDGKIDMRDIGSVAACFGANYILPIHERWFFRCDLTNDRKIDFRDIGNVASQFGVTSAVWTPPPW